MATYSKPWLAIPDQIQQLKNEGLIVEDESKAESFLRHLNYYRFSGYGLVFEQSRHQFYPGSTFEQIRKTYEFDRALRDLVYESMEVIELDVRTSVAYTFGEKYGAFGYAESANFHKSFKHKGWLELLQREIRRSTERFALHFKRKYDEYPNLPIWAATETMSFGCLSRMIQGMEKADLKKVSSRYSLQPAHFTSCLHHLVYVRNVCAHHARLWDRTWDIKPKLPPGKIWEPPILPSNERLFASLMIQATFMKHCHAESEFVQDWKKRIESLIDTRLPQCPNPLSHMGLTPEWKEHPVWQS